MYNRVYEAIYVYIRNIVDNMEIESTFDKKISIEAMDYSDNANGLLIKKIPTEPVSRAFIDGSKELLFKFSIESIQSFIPDDNDYMIRLTQFLDNIAGAIKSQYDNGNKPIIEGFESMELEAITNSSNVEINDNKSRSVIDLSFKYLEKRRRK